MSVSVPLKLFKVKTQQGSRFLIKFIYGQDALDENNNSLRAGEMHVQGYSVSARKDISFCGPGVEPEIGFNIVVELLGENADGPILRYETIEYIESVEEVSIQGLDVPGCK